MDIGPFLMHKFEAPLRRSLTIGQQGQRKEITTSVKYEEKGKEGRKKVIANDIPVLIHGFMMNIGLLCDTESSEVNARSVPI